LAADGKGFWEAMDLIRRGEELVCDIAAAAAFILNGGPLLPHNAVASIFWILEKL
jgi:hypothetical protein